MDIGTLTGTIAIEDQLSHALDLAAKKVEDFAQGLTQNLTGPLQEVAMVAGLATIALGVTTAAITALAVKGSEVNSVAGALDHFAGSARSAASVLDVMNTGVQRTVDNMTLMRSASKLMSTGTLQAADDFKTLTEAAYVLQSQGLGSTTEELGLLQQALITGRMSIAERQVGILDLKSAEEAYAAQLGKTGERLTHTEKIEADRIALLQRLKSIVTDAGAVELDFGNRITAAANAVRNFIDDLAGAIAKSPALNQMAKDIGDALTAAFGPDRSALIEAVVGWVEKYARAVDAVIPYVKAAYDAVASIVKIVYDNKEAITVVLVAYELWTLAINSGLMAAIASLSLEIGAITTETLAASIATAEMAVAEGVLSLATLGVTTAISSLWAVMAANPIGTVLIAVGALGIALKYLAEWYYASALAAETKGAKEDTVAFAVARGAKETISYTDAIKYNTEWSIKHGHTLETVSDALKELGNASWGATDKVNVLTLAVNAAMKDGKLTTKVMEEIAAAVEKSGIAYENLSPELKAILTGMHQMHDAAAQHIKDEKDKADALKKSEAAARKYAEALAEVNTHIANLKLGASQLSDAQKGQIIEFQKLGLSVEQIAIKLHLSTEAVSAFEEEWKQTQKAVTDVEPAVKKFGITLEQIGEKVNLPTWDELTTQMGWLKGSIVGVNAAGNEFNVTLSKFATTLPNVKSSLLNLPVQPIKESDTALKDLASTFEKLGQAAGGALGAIASRFGQIISMANSAAQATHQLGTAIDPVTGKQQEIGGRFGYGSVLFSGDSTGKQKMAAGVAIAGNTIAGIQGFQQAFDQKGTGARLMGSTMAGAQIGSSFGPWGTAVGAAAGFIAGLIKGKPEWGKVQDSMAKDYGTAVSDELSKAIVAGKKDFGGSTQASALSHLTEIIKEAGGLSETNLPKMTARFHDVFSMIEMHQMTVAQGSKVINDNFAAFAEAGTSAYGVLNKDLVDIIALNDQFGTNSKAVLDYVGGQGAQAAQNFGVALTIPSEAMKTQQEDAATLASLYEQLGTAGVSSQAGIQAQIDAVTADMAVQQGIIAATAITSQATADALAAGVAVSFSAMLDAGTSFKDAIAAIEPAMTGLQTQMEAAGLSGSAVFDLLQQEVALYSDAVAGPALQAVDSLSAGMVNLGNMGKLNQDSFTALTAQIGVTFDSLVAQGNDGGAVMLAMKDSLQRVWEEEQQFGYVADATTQALVDQAEAEGIVGEKHKTINQQMLDASNKMVDVLTLLAKHLGVTMPDAAATGADKTNKALAGVKGSVAGVGSEAERTADRTRAAADEQAKAWRDVEDAATGAAEGHSPTGIQQIVVRINELTTLMPPATNVMVSSLERVETKATTVAEAMTNVLRQMYDYYTDTTTLTAAQGEFAMTALDAGVSIADLAAALGVSQRVLQTYVDGVKAADKAQQDAITSLADLIDKMKSADLAKAVSTAVGKMPKGDIGDALAKSQDSLAAARRTLATDALQHQIDDADAAVKEAQSALTEAAKGAATDFYNPVTGEMVAGPTELAIAAATEAYNRAVDAQDALKQQMADLKHGYEVEDTRKAFDAEVKGLGMIPAEYKRTYESASDAIRAQYDAQQTDLVAQRNKELTALGPVPAAFDATYQAAVDAVKAKYDLMADALRESTATQLQDLGPLPDAYAATYQAAFDNVTAKYTELLTALDVTPDLPTMQTYADAYEKTYTTSFDHIAAAHQALLESLAKLPPAPVMIPTPLNPEDTAHGFPPTGAGGGGGFSIYALHPGTGSTEADWAVSRTLAGVWSQDDERRYLADYQARGPAAAAQYLAGGGIVKPLYLSGGADIIPFTPRGTDTVPAMLTPGEKVTPAGQSDVEQPSNADVVAAVEGLRSDLTGKLPRSLARSLSTALVGLRTAS